MWCILRWQGIWFPHVSWKAITLSLLEVWPYKVMRLEMIQVQSQRGMGRQSSAGKEVEASSGAVETDQSVAYIICFTKAVKLYQEKNRNCFGCGSLITLYETAQKTLPHLFWKVDVNTKEGMAKKGGQMTQKPVATQQSSLMRLPQA